MKLQILSDLHLEFFDNENQRKKFIDTLVTDADVVVLLGDIGTLSNLVDSLNYICDKFQNVVYITGNHEYYYSKFEYIHDILYSIDKSNFYYLNDDDCIINGQRFIGCTMWFSDADGCNHYYKHMLNDFSSISDFSQSVYKINDSSIDCLKEHVREDDVVLTHHIPCSVSIAERYRCSEFNRFFICNMENLIKEAKPKLWIHGHTHDSFDYNFEDTRIICNPFGYVNHEENSEFNKHMIIEV